MENELVIYLTNDELSNNYQEGYKEKNPNIIITDNLYEFQDIKSTNYLIILFLLRVR